MHILWLVALALALIGGEVGMRMLWASRPDLAVRWEVVRLACTLLIIYLLFSIDPAKFTL